MSTEAERAAPHGRAFAAAFCADAACATQGESIQGAAGSFAQNLRSHPAEAETISQQHRD